jgi:hypothetical protein
MKFTLKENIRIVLYISKYKHLFDKKLPILSFSLCKYIFLVLAVILLRLIVITDNVKYFYTS